MEQKDTIIQKVYDLLKTTIPFLNTLPRSQKFTLGDKIQTHLSELLELLIRAYYAPPVQKREKLNQVNITLEILRHYFRLCFDLNYIPFKKYEGFAQQLNEIGRMVGGWIKSLER